MRNDLEHGSKREHAQNARSTAFAKIVDLARQELRERGVSEDQIDALLNRRYASDLWEPVNR